MGSIGSTPSFWQQDRSFWQQGQQKSNYLAASTSVINAMSSAETNLGKGLASIANASALKRVDTELTKEIQAVLSGNTGSSSASTGVSSAATTTKPVAATGSGSAVVTTGTSLKSLGVAAGGVITISAGQNTTTYASTGSDTVGDVMNTINSDLVGTAAVTASLSQGGRLVLTSKNTSDTISVGGLYARNIGFGVGNNSFKPTTATVPAPSTPAPPPAPSSTTSSTAPTPKSYTTPATEMVSTAASLLAASGAGGTLVNMLA